MKIVGYLKTSLIEWPGKISAVIFTPGCNFRCPFCHNAALVNGRGVRQLPRFGAAEVLSDLEKRKKWIDGVAFSGGEPLLQTGLGLFLRSVKKMGFATMVETNGSRFMTLRRLVDNRLVDRWALDYKVPFEEYSRWLGASNQDSDYIRRSYRYLMKAGLPLELRTTVVPGIHDEKKLMVMAEKLKEIVTGSRFSVSRPVWFLQGFQAKNCLNPAYQKKKPFSRKKMRVFQEKIRQIYAPVKLREN